MDFSKARKKPNPLSPQIAVPPEHASRSRPEYDARDRIERRKSDWKKKDRWIDREQQLKKKRMEKKRGRKIREKNSRARNFAGIGRLRRSRWRNRYRRWPAICIRGARGWWTTRRKAGFNAHASCIFKPSPSPSLARYSCTRKLNPNARLRSSNPSPSARRPPLRIPRVYA